MESILLALVLLACPVGMGLMMWWMAKGTRDQGSTSREQRSLDELRAEHERLSAEIERREGQRHRRPPLIRSRR
jgi:hypothetical protein